MRKIVAILVGKVKNKNKSAYGKKTLNIVPTNTISTYIIYLIRVSSLDISVVWDMHIVMVLLKSHDKKSDSDIPFINITSLK